MDYEAFVAGKRRAIEQSGFDPAGLHPSLFDHQRVITEWACRMGRSAVFADTGLGKTRIQIEWARQVIAATGGRVLILAPLAVGPQTIREAAAMGIVAAVPDAKAPIAVTNYERLHLLDPDDFAGVVLDESSILKNYAGSTRTAIIHTFARTPYKLACTATPSPNDHTELGNHAEFLGICSREEMLAEYFTHDGGDTSSWRLKGHARTDFWRWVASWAVMVRLPSDLGYEDGPYLLPPLRMEHRTIAVSTEMGADLGGLFPTAATLTEQRKVRRSTVDDRASVVAGLVAAEPAEPFVVWCELNDESTAIARAIPGAVEVRGSDSPEEKADSLVAFSEGRIRVLVTKPSIAGFGLNWQHCARVIFAGPTHSYEQWYQSVRRCWRFGQTREVVVTMVRSDADTAISANLARKSTAADEMAVEMIAIVREVQMANLRSVRPGTADASDRGVVLPDWLLAYTMETP